MTAVADGWIMRLGRVPDHETGVCSHKADGRTPCGRRAAYRLEARKDGGAPHRTMRCTPCAAALALRTKLPFPPGLWKDMA